MTGMVAIRWVVVVAVLAVSGCGNVLDGIGAPRPSNTVTTRADVIESCLIDEGDTESALDAVLILFETGRDEGIEKADILFETPELCEAIIDAAAAAGNGPETSEQAAESLNDCLLCLTRLVDFVYGG